MLLHGVHEKVVFGGFPDISADAFYGEIFEGKCGARIFGQLSVFQIVNICLTVKFPVDDNCAHWPGGHSVIGTGGKHHYAVTAH